MATVYLSLAALSRATVKVPPRATVMSDCHFRSRCPPACDNNIFNESSLWATCMDELAKSRGLHGMFSRHLEYFASHLARPWPSFDELVAGLPAGDADDAAAAAPPHRPTRSVLELGAGDATALLSLATLLEQQQERREQRQQPPRQQPPRQHRRGGGGRSSSSSSSSRAAAAHSAEPPSELPLATPPCVVGLTSGSYNKNALGKPNLPPLLRSPLFPHLSVAAGNASRAVLEGVARRSGVPMPRRTTPLLTSGDFTESLPFPSGTFDLVICSACDKVWAPLNACVAPVDAATRAAVFAAWSVVADETLRVLRPDGGATAIMQHKMRDGSYRLGDQHGGDRGDGGGGGGGGGGVAASALFDGGSEHWLGAATRRLSRPQATFLSGLLRETGALPIELVVGAVNISHDISARGHQGTRNRVNAFRTSDRFHVDADTSARAAQAACEHGAGADGDMGGRGGDRGGRAEAKAKAGAWRWSCALAYTFQRARGTITYSDGASGRDIDRHVMGFTRLDQTSSSSSSSSGSGSGGGHPAAPLLTALHTFGDGTRCLEAAQRLPLLRAMMAPRAAANGRALLPGLRLEPAAWVRAGGAPDAGGTGSGTKAARAHTTHRHAEQQRCAGPMVNTTAWAVCAERCADAVVNTVREWTRRSWVDVMAYVPPISHLGKWTRLAHE